MINNKTISGSVFAVQFCPPAALPHPLVLLHSGEDRIRSHPKPKLKQNTKRNGKTSPEEQPASPSVTPSPAEAPPSPEKTTFISPWAADYHLTEINPSPSAETIRFRAGGGDLPTRRAVNAVQERKQSGYTNSVRSSTCSAMEVGRKEGGSVIVLWKLVEIDWSHRSFSLSIIHFSHREPVWHVCHHCGTAIPWEDTKRQRPPFFLAQKRKLEWELALNSIHRAPLQLPLWES